MPLASCTATAPHGLLAGTSARRISWKRSNNIRQTSLTCRSALSVCLHDVCLTIAFSYTCHLVVGCRLWGTRGRPNYICNSSPLLGILHSVLFLPNSSMLLSAPSYSFSSFVSPPFCLLSSYPSILPLFQSPLILPLILLLFLVSTGDDCLLYM